MATALSIPGVELQDEIGRGSFGGVYRGRHRTLDVDVAVKIVHSQGDPAAMDVALREARLMARLDHPNLLRIHDAGRLEGSIYLVLELMDGACSSWRCIEAALALDVTRQLLQGLQALHDARILHRDIKPANCLLRKRDGRIKLADLGISVEQSTRTEQIHNSAGTVPFMAPELFEQVPRFSHASDLYALGMTLLCMVLDETPYPQGSIAGIMTWSLLGERPPLHTLRPDLSGALSALLLRMVASCREVRPQSVAEALAFLNGAAGQATIGAPTSNGALAQVGPWQLGAQLYASSNWLSYAVTHVQTGVAARLTHLQEGGPLASANALILDSAERAAGLDHPGILRVIDWGTHDGRTYVVTAPRGQTLAALVTASGPRPEVEALELALGVAEALVYLHGRGLVFQMVEPGAIAITPDARSAQLGWPVFCVPQGTPVLGQDRRPQRVMVTRYAAPEALGSPRTGVIDPTVDLYGIGEVLYYLLVGRPASPDGSFQSIAMAKMSPPDVRTSAPLVTARTARLVARLLEPDPTARPVSAAQVRNELSLIAGQLRGG